MAQLSSTGWASAYEQVSANAVANQKFGENGLAVRATRSDDCSAGVARLSRNPGQSRPRPLPIAVSHLPTYI
jgi:hypothetical protein